MENSLKLSEDEEKLETITTIFIKALLANPFEDENKYAELAKRVAGLIELEIRWKLTSEQRRMFLNVWGPLAN